MTTTLSDMPLPTSNPSLHSSRLTESSASCRRHSPTSLYTRNTLGEYSTYAPPCCGCSIGERELTERQLVQELLLLTKGLASESIHVTDTILLRIREIRDLLPTDLLTPRQQADDTLYRYSVTG